MFTSIMTKALEVQKILADKNTMQVAKFAFTKVVRHCSERLTQLNHSSPMVMESDSLSQNPVKTNGDNGLKQIHLLRSETSTVMAPLMVNYAAPSQKAAKLPVYSTHYGAMDGNKTFQSVASFNTGNRYKKETNLKFF